MLSQKQIRHIIHDAAKVNHLLKLQVMLCAVLGTFMYYPCCFSDTEMIFIPL